MKLIKLFTLWMDKRTLAKRIKKDWDRYFRGQIEVMETSDVGSYVKPNLIYFELKKY